MTREEWVTYRSKVRGWPTDHLEENVVTWRRILNAGDWAVVACAITRAELKRRERAATD